MSHPYVYISVTLAATVGPLLAIGPTRRWLIRRFRTLDYASAYLSAATSHFGDVFWGIAIGAGIGSLLGVTVPFLVLALYSQFQTPPRFVNWLAILCAVILAGYYVWRADHIRLIPRLEARQCIVNPVRAGTPDNPSPIRAVVQLDVKCITEAVVNNCEGYLLRVCRWTNEGWEETEWNEPMVLPWAWVKNGHSDIRPGVGRRLVVFSIDSQGNIIPCTNITTPLHGHPVFVCTSTGAPNALRFDVKITSPECPSVDAIMKVQMGNDPFNPFIELSDRGEGK